MNNLSLSIIIDSPNNNFILESRNPSIWTSDKNAQLCYKCNTPFTIFNRKHHCRMCGRIFCYNCVKYEQKIPSYISIAKNFDENYDESNKKVCYSCNKKIILLKNNYKLLVLFSNLPFKIKEIIQLRSINRSWNDIINYIINIYRSIQYKCKYQLWNNIEKNLLLTHYKSFKHHYTWNLRLIECDLIKKNKLDEIFEYYIEDKLYNKKKCNQLLCTSSCANKFSIFHAIELLNYDHILHYNIFKHIFKHKTIRQIIYIIPFFIYKKYSEENRNLIYQLLFPYTKRDLQFTYNLYYHICFQTNIDNNYIYIRNDLWNYITEEQKSLISSTNDFVNALKTNNIYKIKKIIRQNDIILSPLDVSKRIIDIYEDEIQVLTSNSKPILFPIKFTKNNKTDTELILLKFEDLRQDLFSNNMKRFLNIISPELNYIYYEVVPIDINYGLIQIIPESHTLYHIKYELNISLQNFIIKNNKNLSSKMLRYNFMKSCASTCILSYILGIGDRHLENIIITNNGNLSNIDFSYLLGDDPKFTVNEMRITTDMLDMLGGSNSDDFVQLKSHISNSFKKIRKHTSFVYSLLLHLVYINENITLSKIQQHLSERLMLGDFECEATMKIVDVVDNNSNTWKYYIPDFTHSINNFLKKYW